MKFTHWIMAGAIGLLSLQVSAQASKKKKPSKKKKSETESVWNYIDSAPIPDKFKNESIVILGHYEKMKVYPPGKPFKLPGKVNDQVSPHYVMESFSITRFLLQDQSALEKFSTYYFNESEEGKQQITIIKKNGEVKEVDLTKAIEVKESIGFDVYELSFGKYKKIALPGLEVGDMVEFSGTQFGVAVNMTRPKGKATSGTNPVADFLAQQNYGMYWSSSYGSGGGGGALIAVVALTVFYPHIVTTKIPRFRRTEGYHVPEYTIHMNKTYSVVKQAYDIETNEKTLPLEYTVMNNGPKPTLKTKDGYQILHVESEGNEAVKPEYFFQENQNIPALRYTFNLAQYEKFNMHYANTDGAEFNEAAAKTLAKKLVTGRWKANAITKLYEMERSEGKNLKKLDQTGKVKYFFYYYKKNYSLVTYVLSKWEESISEGSMASTKFFQLFCERYDIPYEIVLYSSRGNGPTKNAVSGDRLRWGILAHPDGKDVYLTDFDATSEYDVPHQVMYGSEVFYVDPKNNYSVRSDVFQPENGRNKVIVKTEASLASDGTSLDLNSKWHTEGELKNNMYKLVCTRSDVFKQYQTLLGEKSKDDEEDPDYLELFYYSSDFKAKEKQEQEKDRLSESVDKAFEENQNNKFTEYVEDNYDNDAKVKTVKIENKGLTTIKSDEPEPIDFSVKYSMQHVAYPVGVNSMIIELGRLITDQLELKDISYRTRKYDIDVDYQKTYEAEITLTLPDGYKPMNLADFNIKVENDACSFTSVATEEGGKIKLKYSKVYKKVHMEAADWQKVVEVMDAAAIMFQKKLLLEK